ncbi:MAG: hypothetical protein ACC656_09755 [Candidatus Heimdallarchaeota archaeon]
MILGSYVWIKAINRFFGSFTYYLVEHKWTRKIIAGGSFSYYEYQDPEKQKRSTLILDPLMQVITLLLAFVGMAVFFMGFLGPDAAKNPLIWGALAILVPLLSTPLIPVYWALASTKVKAYAKGNNTTWMVGKKYKNRFNSIITIAAIFTNLRDSSAGDLGDQIKVFIEVVKIGTLVLLIPTSIFIIIYYGWFKEELSGRLQESLSLKTYEIILEEHEMEWVEDDEDVEPAKEIAEDTEEEEGEIDAVEKVSEEAEILNDDDFIREESKTEIETADEVPENVEKEIVEEELKPKPQNIDDEIEEVDVTDTNGEKEEIEKNSDAK